MIVSTLLILMVASVCPYTITYTTRQCHITRDNYKDTITFKRIAKKGALKHIPSTPNTDLHASVTDGNIVLTFDNDIYSNIDITLICGNTITYYNNFEHVKGTPIILPFTTIDDETNYTISIKKGDIEFIAEITLDSIFD